MAILAFNLNPESISKLHDALLCLGKFSDSVSLEASHDKLILTALNSTKSAYASFTLDANKFFSKYDYNPARPGKATCDKFVFRIYNKALLSVFRGRACELNRERDTAVDRCEAFIEHGDGISKSRFTIRIVCKHGVNKTYRLTFESVPSMHALFIKEKAHNHWSMSSKALREFSEHFGPGTEQLDIYLEGGRLNFTSFTEKVMLGSEILKQPLHTTIAVDTLEFCELDIEEMLHITISVKDFKAIVVHSGLNNLVTNVFYSYPSCPMQISYHDDGVWSEFILMTTAEARVTPASQVPNLDPEPKPVISKLPEEVKSNSKRSTQILTPSLNKTARVYGQRSVHDVNLDPYFPAPLPSTQSESLFIPRANDECDDQIWNPINYDEEDSEMLMWDDGKKNTSKPDLVHMFNDFAGQDISTEKNSSGINDDKLSSNDLLLGLPPTQKLSQIRNLGIFD